MPLLGMVSSQCTRTCYNQPTYQIWRYEMWYKMWKMWCFRVVRGHWK